MKTSDKTVLDSRIFPELSIDKESPLPIHVQLTEALRSEIIRNRPRSGTPLPSERQLSEELEINRDTVHRAYETLTEDGFLTRPPGRRTIFIADKAREKYRPSFPAVGIMMPRGFSYYVNMSQHGGLGYLGGIIDRATELRHSTIILTPPPSDEKPKKIEEWIEGFISRTVGILYLGSRELLKDAPLEALIEDKRTPQVFVSGYSDRKHISSICCDASSGGAAAAKHLRDLGHRRVGIIQTTWLPLGIPHIQALRATQVEDHDGVLQPFRTDSSTGVDRRGVRRG